jgi:hypothetical protein
MAEPKKVVKQIPEEKIGLIREQLVSKSHILQMFLKASLGTMRMEKELEKAKAAQNQMYEQLQENKKAFEKVIGEIATSLGLDKEYNWHFDGEGAFIGVPQIQLPISSRGTSDEPKLVEPKAEEEPKK